jgi:hypothetical protein
MTTRIREGKSKNAKRVIPLTDWAAALLMGRWNTRTSGIVFGNREGQPYVGTSINHLHQRVSNPKLDGKQKRIFPRDFVLHPLRHTMLTRLGESGVEPSASSHRWSQQYHGFAAIHPPHPGSGGAGIRPAAAIGKRPRRAIEPKRLPPATVSATLDGAASVSH